MQAVDRITEIIDFVASRQNGCTLSELAAGSALPKTTVHRTLNALADKGFLMKGENNLYRIGYKFLILAKKYLGSLDIREVAAPYLKALAAELNATAHIAVLQQDKAVYIEKIRPFSFECVYSDIGKTIDLYCSGLGKSLLLGVSPDILESYLSSAKMERFTPNTLDEGALRAELRRAAGLGYTVDNAEHEEGVYCIAAPVYDYTQNVIAAVSVSRGDKEFLENKEVVGLLLKCADEISKKFGSTKAE